MSGLRPWGSEDAPSDDGDVVSHDSAGEIEDTRGALEMLKASGPPSAKVGLPDNLIEGIAKPDEIAEIIVKTERIHGETGSFYGLITEICGKLIKDAIDAITGFATTVEFNGLRDKVVGLEKLVKGKGTEDDEPTASGKVMSDVLAKLSKLEDENKALREELDKLSIDFSEFSAGAREIYNSFQAERVVEVNPQLDKLMAELAEANRQRDEALKKGASTTVSSGGTLPARAPSQAHRRSNTTKATTVAEFQSRFTPPLTRAEAARRFADGER